MQANKALTQIISFDSIDQTDDTFYLIAACNPHDCRRRLGCIVARVPAIIVRTGGRYIEQTSDMRLRDDFYVLLKNYTLHYFAPGARSLGQVIRLNV